jgi:ribulose-phosphate 3-epimerase
MHKPIKIAPSILAADFTRLGEEVIAAQQAGADQIHVDVMDGHFAPNLSMGPFIVRWVRQVTDLPLDVHLMISNPDSFLEPFAEAGASILTVHVEACTHLHRTIQAIHALGLKAGVTLNPATPVSTLSEIIPDVDLVLVMSVSPGWGGQSFIERSVRRLEQVRRMLDAENPACDLEIDGGIDLRTAGRVVAAGANVLVAGTAIFGAQEGIAAAIATLRQTALEAAG